MAELKNIDRPKSFTPLPKWELEGIKSRGIDMDYANAWIGVISELKNQEEDMASDGQTNINIEKYKEYLSRKRSPTDTESIIDASDPERIAKINAIVDEFNTLNQEQKSSRMIEEKFWSRIRELIYEK